MNRILIMMRHGHAKDIPDGHSGLDGDFHRELRDKGKRAAQRQGIWLARHGYVPDHVVTSPAIRAQRTAEKAIKTGGQGVAIIEPDQNLYPGRWKDLLKRLHQSDRGHKTLMIVGHNPGLEELASHIAKDKLPMNDKGAILPPGAVAIFAIKGDWDKLGRKTAKLLDLVRPKDLPERFPWPDSNGQETRVRPAYYYRQSSVIPWRRDGGHLEVLVISSSNKNHVVVPKGIHDPGMTSQESAAKEAREEAGIEGRVIQAPIGHYRYEKWEATCEVAVYAMEVTSMLTEFEWEESHRGRIWKPVEMAAELVLNDDVAALIRALPAFLAKEEGN